jgi:hypothetical protein
MADTTSLHLRLPKKLYKRLQQQARRNNVSLNTEIVNQLEGYEAATVKRTTEIVQPLLKEAVYAAAATAAEVATDITRDKALQEALDRIERWAAERGMSIMRRPQTADEEAKALERQERPAGDIGEPVRKHHVIPLRNPISETPEPKVPLPENAKEKEKTPAKELEKSSGILWTLRTPEKK